MHVEFQPSRLARTPIYVKLDVGHLSVSTEEIIHRKRTSWQKASEQAHHHFKSDLAEKLNSMEVPACISCQDIHCKVHTEDIENYAMNVLQTIEECAQASLP